MPIQADIFRGPDEHGRIVGEATGIAVGKFLNFLDGGVHLQSDFHPARA
jgi:hypothetical protein